MFSGECVDSRRRSSSRYSSSIRRSSSRIRSRESIFWNSQLRCYSPCPSTEISKNNQTYTSKMIRCCLWICLKSLKDIFFMVGKRQRYVGSRSEKLGFADPNPNSWGAVKRGRTSWADVKDGTTWNKIVNTEYVGKIWKWINEKIYIYILYISNRLIHLPTYELTCSCSYCTCSAAYLRTHLQSQSLRDKSDYPTANAFWSSNNFFWLHSV